MAMRAAELIRLLSNGQIPETPRNPARSAALRDQIAAARRDGMTMFNAVMKVAAPEGTTRVRSGEWVQLSVHDTLAHWITGEGRTCLHDPNPRRPEPVWACAWKPRLVVCSLCTVLLAVRGQRSLVCDACGHQCAGLDADDPIDVVTVWAGSLAFQYGLCQSCAAENAVK